MKKLLAVFTAILMIFSLAAVPAAADHTAADRAAASDETPAETGEITYDFETDPALDGWTFEDSDGDGYNWFWCTDTFEHIAPEGGGCMISESFCDPDGTGGFPLTPDNWLISPEIPGGGYLSFMYVSQSFESAYANEHIGVYASADGGQSWSEELGYFTTNPVESVQTGEIDLSAFANQNIKIAFRHYNSTDQLAAAVDMVTVYQNSAPVPTETPTAEPVPTETPAPTAEPVPIPEPTPEPTPVTGEIIGYCFETDPYDDGWTTEDRDGDGFNWNWLIIPGFNYPEGRGMMSSQSYDNAYGALTPDNWLISPLVPGGGTVSFKIVAQDFTNTGDTVGIYVSCDNGVSWSDELGRVTANEEVETHVISLADYQGQAVKLAFRHYNSEAHYWVNLDAVEIAYTGENPVPPPAEDPIPKTGWYFETDPWQEGWTREDNDGDGKNWEWLVDEYCPIPEGTGCMQSRSYSAGALTPDNWLISPAFNCGGQAKFKLIADEGNYLGDVIGVFVSADGGESWSDELCRFETTMYVQNCIVDLSDYIGQEIKLAFRHYDCEGIFRADLDAVVVTLSETHEIFPGDYDCNGIVNVQDAILTLRAAMGLITPSEQSLLNADIDGSGILTVTDAITVLRMAMGLI